MNLEKIKGHTYFLKGGTNTGVYLFKDKYCLLIDPGMSNSRGNIIVKTLSKENIRIGHMIVTHEHNDHYGSCESIKNQFTGALTYSSAVTKTFIENPLLFSIYIYGSNPPQVLLDFFKSRGTNLKIDQILPSDCEFKINDKKFFIYSLAGHCMGHCGILTEDKVLFLGDSLFDPSILEKYNFPFLFDIQAQINSLNKIKDIDFEFAVLGHGKEVLTKEKTIDVINLNIATINKYINQIKEFLETPYSKEDLLKDLILYNGLELNFKEYHFSISTVSAFLTYLLDLNLIEHSLEDGKLYYYLK